MLKLDFCHHSACLFSPSWVTLTTRWSAVTSNLECCDCDPQARRNDITEYVSFAKRCWGVTWEKSCNIWHIIYRCKVLLHVNPPCVGAIPRSDLFRPPSADLPFASGAFLTLFTASFYPTYYSLIAFRQKKAQSPRNLALSVCRTNFPRFSDTSGGWATSTRDPSAARILDPLRRSWPLKKPPCSAYTLRMRRWFLLESNALWIFLNLAYHTSTLETCCTP